MSLGLAQHNPTDIRYNADNDWVGEVGNNGGFSIFDNDKDGIRAFVKLFLTYTCKYGIDNFGDFFSRFTSGDANNYPAALAADGRWSVSDKLGSGKDFLLQFVPFVIRAEIGSDADKVSSADISAGIDAGLGGSDDSDEPPYGFYLFAILFLLYLTYELFAIRKLK